MGSTTPICAVIILCGHSGHPWPFLPQLKHLPSLILLSLSSFESPALIWVLSALISGLDCQVAASDHDEDATSKVQVACLGLGS